MTRVVRLDRQPGARPATSRWRSRELAEVTACLTALASAMELAPEPRREVIDEFLAGAYREAWASAAS